MFMQCWSVTAYGTTLDTSAYDPERALAYIQENAEHLRSESEDVFAMYSPTGDVPKTAEELSYFLDFYEDENSELFGIVQVVLDVIKAKHPDIVSENIAIMKGEGMYDEVLIGITPWSFYPWDTPNMPQFSKETLVSRILTELKLVYSDDYISENVEWDIRDVEYCA